MPTIPKLINQKNKLQTVQRTKLIKKWETFAPLYEDDYPASIALHEGGVIIKHYIWRGKYDHKHLVNATYVIPKGGTCGDIVSDLAELAAGKISDLRADLHDMDEDNYVLWLTNEACQYLEQLYCSRRTSDVR